MNFDISSQPTQVPGSVQQQWQAITNILCQTLDIPIALVMRVNWPNIEVLISSEQQQFITNPYRPGDKEILTNSGLYCETVIGNKQELLVANAASDETWANNPDMKYGLCSYLGYPIIEPDGKVFGTLCVLDGKENHYDANAKALLQQFKELLETHLALLEKNQALTDMFQEVSRLNAQLDLAAKTDPLTQALNRSTFEDTFRAEQARAERKDFSNCLLVIDLDHFKKINDDFGHNAGDTVLKAVAKALKHCIRRYDHLWRWGGEEFLILLSETRLEDAIQIADDIRQHISEIDLNVLNHAPLTISVGVVVICRGEEPHKSIQRADELLYQAKHRGRNQVQAERIH
jgi:diguanylate cyclase (GGDEF)-like protein